MITHVEKFVLSQSPYALKPHTYKLVDKTWQHEGRTIPHFDATVEALWVRRTRGILGVHTGVVYDLMKRPDITFDEFRDLHDSARYGGTPYARWDGHTLWTPSPVPRTEEDALIAVLDPALRHIAPLIEAQQRVTAPDGWSGWYRLTEKPRR